MDGAVGVIPEMVILRLADAKDLDLGKALRQQFIPLFSRRKLHSRQFLNFQRRKVEWFKRVVFFCVI